MNSISKGQENSGGHMTAAGLAQSSLEAVARCVPSNGIDFGYCGVTGETHRKITLDNTVSRSVSGQTVRYSIETDSTNFTVSHSKGKLHTDRYVQ